METPSTSARLTDVAVSVLVTMECERTEMSVNFAVESAVLASTLF